MAGMTRRRFIPLLKACNNIATAKHDGGRACKIVMDDYIIHFLLENENSLLSKPHHLIPWKELWRYILDHVAGHRFTRNMKSNNNSFRRLKRIGGHCWSSAVSSTLLNRTERHEISVLWFLDFLKLLPDSMRWLIFIVTCMWPSWRRLTRWSWNFLRIICTETENFPNDTKLYHNIILSWGKDTTIRTNES